MPIHISDVTAVVLAGGFGTRIKHLLPQIPKPMAPVAGKPFLEWVIRYLKSQGIRDVILSTGYLSDQIETYFQENPISEMGITCRPETHPMGTAGGFLNAINHLPDNHLRPAAWLVLNGDTLAMADLLPLVNLLNDTTVDGGIVGIPMPDTTRYGTLFFNAQNELIRFIEKQPGQGVINSGLFLIRNTVLKHFPIERPLGFEDTVFPNLLKQGSKFKVQISNGPFLDIGTPDSLAQADRFVVKNAAHLHP